MQDVQSAQKVVFVGMHLDINNSSLVSLVVCFVLMGFKERVHMRIGYDAGMKKEVGHVGRWGCSIGVGKEMR